MEKDVTAPMLEYQLYAEAVRVGQKSKLAGLLTAEQ